MDFMSNGAYGKSTMVSVFLHSALIAAFLLVPPSTLVEKVKSMTTVEILPAPAPPKPLEKLELPKPDTKPEPQNQVKSEQAASDPEPARFADALPGEAASLTSVALKSGTGTGIPSSTGIPPGKTYGGTGGSGSGSAAASRVYAPKPAYPRDAKAAGWEGSVVLKIRINADGSVTVLSVLQAGRADVSEAAVQAVSGWQYLPARDESGVPVASTRNIRVNFDLRDEG